MHKLVKEREQHGPYASFIDFCKRLYGTELNRRALESLIKCGALDNLGYNRREMLTGAGALLEQLDADRRRNIDGQIGFFDTPEEDAPSGSDYELAAMEEYLPQELLNMEKEVTGMFISGHPMAAFANRYEAGDAVRLVDLQGEEGEEPLYRDEQPVCVLGLITSVKQKVTRSNATMAFVTVEDMTGSAEVLVFPQVYGRFLSLLREGNIVCLRGKLSLTEEKEPKILCDSVWEAPKPGAPMPGISPAFRPKRAADSQPDSAAALRERAEQTPQTHTAKYGLYLKFPSRQSFAYRKAMQYTAIFDGRIPLYLYFEDEKKLVRAPVSLFVDENEVLLRELKRLLGEKNVVLRS